MAQKSNFAINMYGAYTEQDVRLISGIIEGGINDIPLARIEFVSKDKLLDLADFVGSEIGFSIAGEKDKMQRYYGTCISAEYMGSPTGNGHYFAEVSPWIWFLTRAQDSFVYQNMTTTAIVKEVLKKYGFSGDLVIEHDESDPDREYCVQYNETDFDFIKRLLEEDGIYFYFRYAADGVKMVLADTPNTHPAVPVDDKLPYRDDKNEQQLDHISRWESTERALSGKFTLNDYDFTNPSSDLTSAVKNAKGKHANNDPEIYKYPGRFRTADAGEKFARFGMGAITAQHQVWSAGANIPNLCVGHTFTLLDHPRHTARDKSDFMVIRAKQFFRVEPEGNAATVSMLEELHPFGIAAFENTRIEFEAVLKSAEFRMPCTTPRPIIPGVQTAVVTGPKGAEIETDQYGRIKVQFHWDRKGKRDEKSSCWVRTMMPMSGKAWGSVAVPRVGQEVVIQFEEGDPDRPLCIGTLYNAEQMPPYDLPANATRTGVKTDSSKGGGGYNELMFEDKKGDELLRFVAQKDYVQNIQNSAHVKVGYAPDDDVKKAAAQADRSMKLEVENHLDELVEKGDHSFEVKAGKQTLKIKKNKTETIEGKSMQTVTGDVKEVVKMGNYDHEVKMGNVTRAVKMGNESTTLDMGDYTLDTSLGKIELTALQSIKLTVGGSSILVDQFGITIKGMMVKVEGTAMLDAKAPVAKVTGSGMLTLKGGITMIN